MKTPIPLNEGELRFAAAVLLIVLLTISTIILITNLLGVVLPFALTKLKLDPAIASGPLITSVADAVGLVIYFTYAVIVLGIVM